MSASRPDRPSRDRGSISVLAVVMVPALLAAAGLVLDGGRQLEVRRQAQGAAQAAARAAVQPTSEEVLSGRLDAHRAAARAHAELAREGMSGTVDVIGDEVVVTVTASVDYVLLPGGASISETASAVPRHGVEGSGS